MSKPMPPSTQAEYVAWRNAPRVPAQRVSEPVVAVQERNWVMEASDKIAAAVQAQRAARGV